MVERICCLDLEMTGLSLKRDRVVEFSAWEILDGQVADVNITFLINPDRPIPSKTERIHGISDEMVADKPFFAQLASQILDFLGKDPIAIFCPEQNDIVVDSGFLNLELDKAGFPPIPDDRFINLKPMAERLFRRKSLNDILAFYDIENLGRSLEEGHGAELDAYLLAQLYPKLVPDWEAYQQERATADTYSSAKGGNGALADQLQAWSSLKHG